MKVLMLIGLAAAALAAGLAHAATVPGKNGRIVYSEQTQGNDYTGTLFAVNADSTGRVELQENGVNPVWSPDGKRVLFESSRKGDEDLWTVNADASSVRELTFSRGRDGDGAWSPDGSKIAFESGRNGVSEIYVMNADGSGVQRLTVNDPVFDGDPSWSPDGSKIAFTSSRSGSKQIWVMNADGSSPRQLTSAAGVNENPAWSPDGTQVAFDTD